MSEVLYFGWVAHHGHDLRSKTRHVSIYTETPWGVTLDGGLLTCVPDNPNGAWAEHHEGGWTAIAFWDRSGDARPNSNSAFLVHEAMTGEALLSLALEQWPEVFGRPGFPLKPAATEMSKV